MQDKEFDRLFNSKLDNFEIEPSPMVWENIASELHEKKAKRNIVPYLSIAASIIVLVSVGLLFFNKTEDAVKPVKRGKVVVKINKAVVPYNSAKDNTIPEAVITNTPASKVATVSKLTIFKAPKVIIDEAVNKTITETNELVSDPVITNQPAFAIIAPVQKQPGMVVPDKETSFAVATDDKQQVIETTTTEITSAETMKTPVKKRGIHSLGGLIGALVAKVDKREDKLIEFTESDENGSTITGLNLGLIKIKKK